MILVEAFNIAELTKDEKLIEAFRSTAEPVRILKFGNFPNLNLEQSP